MKTYLAAITTGLTLLMAANAASAVELYNGLLGTTPAQQGWTLKYNPLLPRPGETVLPAGGIVFDTSGNISKQGGYFKQSTLPTLPTQLPVVLDRGRGYNVTFTLKVDSQSSGSNDKAGFSFIVTSNAIPGEVQPSGIELNFWQGAIWGQNYNFTRGEAVPFNTTALHTYRLFVQGSIYQLFVDGSATPILQGPLRQYYGYVPPTGYTNPYIVPNQLFMGNIYPGTGAKVTIVNVGAQ